MRIICAAKRTRGLYHPCRGVGILPSVFPYARHICRNVAYALIGHVKRGRQQRGRGVPRINKRVHCACKCRFRVVHSRYARPCLAYKVYAAVFVLRAAKRLPAGKIRPLIPCAVPCVRLHGLFQPFCVFLIYCRALTLAHIRAKRHKAHKHIIKEHAEPHALPAAAANAVHPVVPVSPAHKRQPVRTDGKG